LTRELDLPAGRWLLLRKRGERVEAQEFDLAPAAKVTLSARQPVTPGETW
jgi:hypothetical protein